jgi:sporulation protein YlmC with PRC-barrel domain
MKLTTAAGLAVLAIATTQGFPRAGQAEGAHGHDGPAVIRVAGPLSRQPQEAATPTQSQGEGHNDQKQAGTIQSRQPDMVLVSNLLNATVYGADRATVGEIEDIIIKSDGKIEGMVVSVGGFLGIGEKNVALKMDRFKVMPEADGNARITVLATKEELREAAEFKTKQGRGA